MFSVSNFENARDFKIGQLAIYNYSNAAKTALAYLHDNSTIGALHNSNERCDTLKCREETRVTEEAIFSLITHGERDSQPKTILWLSGPAGAGKTAIAGSIPETCKQQGEALEEALHRDHRIQLLQHETLRDVGRRILSTIDTNPAMFETRLKDQLEELILKPLRDSQPPSNPPRVIIIDGLDEVEPDQDRASKEDVHLDPSTGQC